MGFGLPSWSDVKNTVSSTVSSAASTVTSAATTVRDLGGAAVERTKELAQDGVDIGRRAVDAVRSIDVREAASVAREAISNGTGAARGGIKTAVEWTSEKTGEAADFARDNVPGGDNVVSNAVRGAITMQENSTRFTLGVVGGVSREVVGLAGTVGELGVTATEMQISQEARVEYGQQIVDGAVNAAEATGGYIQSVANDPSRLGSDITNAAGGAKDWAGGQIDRYETAFREGKGFETVGMDVGTVATYVVPVGGGPARGALTAAVRGGGEAAVRGGVETVARTGAQAVGRETTEAAAREGLSGARAAERGSSAARTVEQMGSTLRGTTRAELERLQAAGMSNKQLGPAISTVMDSRTGAISSTYTNATTRALPENLNPALAERLGAAEQVDYIKTRGAGTHSEIYAANELLNKGSRLEDLVVYTEQIGGKHAGGVKPPCPHCSILLDGARYAE